MPSPARLADALRAFPGFKVWIDGPVTPFEKKNGGGGTIAVEGYGILAPPRRHPVPSDAPFSRLRSLRPSGLEAFLEIRVADEMGLFELPEEDGEPVVARLDPLVEFLPHRGGDLPDVPRAVAEEPDLAPDIVELYPDERALVPRLEQRFMTRFLKRGMRTVTRCASSISCSTILRGTRSRRLTSAFVRFPIEESVH